MKKCLIISNQNIYDLININGLINYLSKKYNLLYLIINITNFIIAEKIFINIPNLILICENSSENIIKMKDIEILKLNICDNSQVVLINDFSIDYFKIFYENIKLKYELKYTYEYLERDFEEEDKFFKKIVDDYQDGYIFYYNHNKDKKLIIDDYKLVFNPIYNYYEDDESKKDKWKDIKHNTLFDLLKIIENSDEIHLFDINLYSFMPFLNLKKVKKKYIYFDNILIKNYHKNLKDFTFIYYNN